MNLDNTCNIESFFRDAAVKRPRDLEADGLNRVRLATAVREGNVERLGRGLYRLSESPVTENHSFVLAAKRVPRGVICLLSALRFHNLTTQNPHEVWMALPQHSWRPTEDGQPLRLIWLSPQSFKAGVETHKIEGLSVNVYSVAKTVADCFKYRNKIGVDVAMEALRDAWRGKRCTIDELMKAARLCRVANVMRPYLESLTQ
jgi:predicted transcriptional regulator of viral defense system